MTKHQETIYEEEPTTTQQHRTMRSRINREVVILKSDDDEIEEVDNIYNEPIVDEEDDELNEEHAAAKRDKSLLQHIFTGSLLTDGTVPYYRYFIAIAVMCFLSIFLTFLSLNTGHEYRRKERLATMLHERSVVKEEQRYGLSSKSAITTRLKEHNIELVDLSKKSRLIER